MKPTHVKTLLAVTLAAAAPASAGPAHEHHRHTTPAAHAAPATPAGPAREPTLKEREIVFRAWQTQQRSEQLLATFGMMRPRALPSGAPACGNVQSKSPPTWQRECFAAHAAEEAAKAAKAKGNS